MWNIAVFPPVWGIYLFNIAPGFAVTVILSTLVVVVTLVMETPIADGANTAGIVPR